MMKIFAKLVLPLVLIGIVSCNSEKQTFEGDQEVSAEKFLKFYDDQISEEMIDSVRSKNIYFGHHSVGRNILSGIKELGRYDPKFKLCVEALENRKELGKECIHSVSRGKNRDYISKINGFYEDMVSGLGENADIAFFKFCYVDMGINTDVRRMFQDYRTSMEKLKHLFPKVVFVHLSMPLKNEENKKNIKRNQYNCLLRKHYGGKEPIFDLADIESKNPFGEICTFRYWLKKYPKLCPIYTDDGGHLNKLGQIKVGAELLIFLSKLSAMEPR